MSAAQFAATIRTEIDYPICTLDNFKIVFNHNHSMSFIYKRIDRF